jgi:hypothetical protein
MPWDKKPVQSNTVYATVGAVACYKFKFVQEDNDFDTDFEFQKCWIKGYGVQTGSLHWSQSEDTLYVGFDDGSV